MNLVTNIQKYSIHDGDGIRTTVFFKGCPLKCEWCHNPETQRFERELQCDKEKCIGCGTCAILTALDAADQINGKPTVIIANTVKGKGVSFAENVIISVRKAFGRS